MTPPNALAAFQHVDWAAMPVEQIADGIERQMIWGERVMVCRLRLAPRTVTPMHTHLHEQITIVERGRVPTSSSRARSALPQPATCCMFPSDILHGATMLDEEVVLIDIFSPLREDFLARRDGR